MITAEIAALLRRVTNGWALRYRSDGDLQVAYIGREPW